MLPSLVGIIVGAVLTWLVQVVTAQRARRDARELRTYDERRSAYAALIAAMQTMMTVIHDRLNDSAPTSDLLPARDELLRAVTAVSFVGSVGIVEAAAQLTSAALTHPNERDVSTDDKRLRLRTTADELGVRSMELLNLMRDDLGHGPLPATFTPLQGSDSRRGHARY